MSIYILLPLAIIIWLCVSILAIRSMNEADGDSVEWSRLPLYWKIILLAISPLLFLIFERHILEK